MVVTNDVGKKTAAAVWGRIHPMRIMYIHQFFRLPEQGGGIRSYELARRWVDEGHEVTVITSDMWGDKTEPWRSTVSGVDVIWLPVSYHQTMSLTARLRSFFGFMYQTAVAARTVPRCDIVLATSTPLTVAIPGAYAARRHKAKFAFEVRDLWPEVPIALGSLSFAPMRWAARALERFAYWRADHIVALSPGMAAGVAAEGVDPADISVIPNSSDLEVFTVDASVPRAFIAERPHLGSGPLLIYTGTFGEVNNAAWLVDVMAELVHHSPDAQLLLVGFGSQEDQIRARAKDLGLLDSRIHIEGYVPKREIAAALAAADVTFSTVADIAELEHNSANKVFDAFAAGTTMAINHGGWLADLLTETGAGLVLSRDPSTAAAQLHEHLADPAALTLSAKAAAELGRHFDRDWHASNYLEIMNELAQRGRAAGRDLVEHGPAGSP